MKHIIKTSFILATILLGVVLSQSAAPQNGTQVLPQNGTQPQQNGTQPQQSGTQPQQSGSQGGPSGSGMMRSGNKPDGPSNVPPQQPGITDKLANITDSRFVMLKNILQYLPPVEQDLLAGKLFSLNSFFFIFTKKKF